jgi:hypothetical protein
MLDVNGIGSYIFIPFSVAKKFRKILFLITQPINIRRNNKLCSDMFSNLSSNAE